MNIAAFLKILHAAFFCPGPNGRWGLPLLLWGDPGSGKTAQVARAARRTGLSYYRLSPAERGEGQFGVVPVPGADGFLHYPAPDWAAELSGGGIIFVDEISCCAPALQAPLLGFVQLGVLGSHQFGPRTRIIGAANETMDAAGGHDLAASVGNRFGHLHWPSDPTPEAVGAWVDWLLGGRGVNPDAQVDAIAEEKRVEEIWPGCLAAASGMVAGFVTRNPGVAHRKPKQGDPSASQAWPSWRTWEYATLALAAATAHDLSEAETDTFMGAFIGEAVLLEFAAWRQHADLPNAGDLLDGKVTFEHDPRRVDRTMVVLGTCAALVAPDKAVNRKDRANACWRIIGDVLKSDSDVAIPAARTLCNSRLHTLKDALPVLAKVDHFLVAAGYRQS